MSKKVKILKICIDDGSSNLKFGVVGNEDIKLTLPSFAKRGITLDAENNIHRDCFSFENNLFISILSSSAELVNTDSREYQYSDVNLALISKAVRDIIEPMKEEERPEEIELSVTLPTDLFSIDMFVKNKKENLKELALCADGFKLPKIKNVKIYPEAISAFYGIYKTQEITASEQSLILDFGGATIGICLIEGGDKIIFQTEIRSTEYSGSIPIARKLGIKIANDFKFPSVPLPAAMKALIAGSFGDKDYSDFIKEEVNNMYLQVMDESNRLANINFIDNIFIVGGGANLVNKYVEHNYKKIALPEYLNLDGMRYLEGQ